MLWALLGCMGTLQTGEGAEPVRAALYLEVEEPAMIGLSSGQATLLLLLNSSLPCDPEEVADDLGTEKDEAAMARSYWEVQVASAFAREGALAVGLVLYRGEDEDRIGRYEIHEDTILAPDPRVEADGRAAAGFWYRVDESEVDEEVGVELINEVEASSGDMQVGAPAWAEVERDEDGRLAGRFDFSPSPLGGTFRAERCGNDTLRNLLYARLIEAGLL